MNSSCLHLLIVSVVLVLLANYSSAMMTRNKKKECAVDCMKQVYRCRREVISGYRSVDDGSCCDEYRTCYRVCVPGASPGCRDPRRRTTGKRGSWNKRAQQLLGLPDEALVPDFASDVDADPWEREINDPLFP